MFPLILATVYTSTCRMHPKPLCVHLSHTCTDTQLELNTCHQGNHNISLSCTGSIHALHPQVLRMCPLALCMYTSQSTPWGVITNTCTFTFLWMTELRAYVNMTLELHMKSPVYQWHSVTQSFGFKSCQTHLIFLKNTLPRYTYYV